MLDHASFCVTAWAGPTLIGVACSVPDFPYACTLSDVAVDTLIPRRVLGKTLAARTKARLGTRCGIRLVAAPKPARYDSKLGFTRNGRVGSWARVKPREAAWDRNSSPDWPYGWRAGGPWDSDPVRCAERTPPKER